MATMTPLQFELLMALGRGPLHGYALVTEVGRVTGKRPGVATVYAALVKLEAREWVVAAGDEIVDGRVRRHFELTNAGISALTAEANEMAQRAANAKQVLRQHRSKEALA